MQLEPQAQQVSAQFLMSQDFSPDKSTCLSKNPSLFICSDKECFRDNPYMCGQRQCECWSSHDDCTFVKLETFFKKIKLRVFSTAPIEACIDQVFDEVIDQLSTLRDQLIGQVRKSGLGHHFSNILVSNSDNLIGGMNKEEGLKVQSKLTGSRIHQLISSSSDKQNQQKILNLTQKINQLTKKFKSQSITSYNNQLTQLLLTTDSSPLSQTKLQLPFQVQWSQQLKGQKLIIQGRQVISHCQHDYPKFCLLEPSLYEFTGKMVKWRIKLVKVSGWIGVGIGLRNALRAQRFGFNTKRFAQNPCYLLTTQGMNYAYHNITQSHNNKYGISYISGDYASIEFDPIEWTVKFKNQRTQESSTLNILHQSPPQQDEYHACVVFSSNSTEGRVQLFGDMVTDQLVYRMKGETQEERLV